MFLIFSIQNHILFFYYTSKNLKYTENFKKFPYIKKIENIFNFFIFYNIILIETSYNFL